MRLPGISRAEVEHQVSAPWNRTLRSGSPHQTRLHRGPALLTPQRCYGIGRASHYGAKIADSQVLVLAIPTIEF